MSQHFTLNTAILLEAGQLLAMKPGLYWLLGGSCTGKSAVARWISDLTGMDTLDMDSLIYGRFMGAYSPERHPAACSWFRAENPLEWALSLGWDEFSALNRACDAEFLELLAHAHELADDGSDQELLVDGGFSHPAVLSSIIPVSRIVTLAAGDEIRFRIWENDPERATMKQSVQALPDGQAKWQKFLYFDKMIHGTMLAESEAAGIPIVYRGEADSIEQIARSVISAFGAGMLTGQPSEDQEPAAGG